MEIEVKKKQKKWQDITPAKKGIVVPKKPAKKRPELFKRAYVYIRAHKIQSIIIGAILLVALCAALFLLLRPKTTLIAGTEGLPGTTRSQTILVPGTPSYDTLLPVGKSLKDLGGGYVRNDKNPLFVFVDKIGAVPINVSEQPLPESFKTDTDQRVKDLAIGFGASTKITVDGGNVYIGTYDRGLQRVIFTKNSLLILMSANTNINSADWSRYISSLK